MLWDHSLRALAAAVILALSWPSPVSAAPHGSSLEVDVGLFYDDLAAYGRWYEVDDYGWVWSPRTSAGWRPYTVGQWVWTDEYGWMWTSDEPYSWAVYHYGRWDADPELGWVWVPGYDWAPAWVSFRSGGGYVGWAPLPPLVSWDVGAAFRVGGVHFDTYISPRHYCFVEERSFLDRDVGRHAFPVSRNVTIVNVTRNVTDYEVSGGRVMNRSLSVDRVERFTRRPVPRVRAVEVSSIREVRNARVRGDRVEVFRPVVRRDADRREVEERRKAEERRQLDESREAERLQRAELRREDERRRLAEQGRRAEQQRVAERQRELDRQREADRREQERRIVRAREEREEQRRELERRQQREREAVEARHRQEIKRPSRDPREDLDRRYSQEHRAVEERQHRERQQVEAQREQARRERDAQGERRAAADAHGSDNNNKKSDSNKKNESSRKREREKERSRERPPGR